MGFPIEMFTVLFAIPRMSGWLAHWKELLEQDQKIAGPASSTSATTTRTTSRCPDAEPSFTGAMSAVPSPPRVYVHSWAARGGRRLVARIIDSAPAGLLVAVAVALVHQVDPSPRTC